MAKFRKILRKGIGARSAQRENQVKLTVFLKGKRMKRTKMLTILVLAVGCSSLSNAAPIGTAWTYQGRLMDANSAADGEYDFEFKLFDDPNIVDGNQVGSDVKIPQLDVIDGYFTVELDFGSEVFDGNARWLEIVVRPGDSNDVNDFVALSPRQQVTPTPYALYAATAPADSDWIISGNDMYAGVTNVGIGTSNPRWKFHQVGSEHVVEDADIVLRRDGMHRWRIMEGESTGMSFQQVYNDSDSTNNEVYMEISDSGNIGIGTTSPEGMLHIKADKPQLRLEESDANDKQWHIEAYNSGFGIFETDEDDRLYIETGDNVGIGSSSPDAKLNILNNSSDDSFRVDDRSGDDTPFVINSGGYVGIGTSSPDYPLHVLGSKTGYLAYFNNELDDSSATNGIYVRADSYDSSGGQDATGAYIIGRAGSGGAANAAKACSAHAYAFGTSDAYAIYASAIGGTTSGDEWAFYGLGDAYFSGKVGIGTASIWAQLDVREDEVRIWSGSGSDGHANGEGSLYVENILEVDGDVYVDDVYNTGISTGKYVYMSSDGRLGYYSSSKRYKENIAPLKDDFSKILQAEPVTFTSKESKERGLGLIAEDIDSLGLSSLVIYDAEGRADSVRYEWICLYLLEVLKGQVETTKQLKVENESLKRQLKAQNKWLKQRVEVLERTMQQLAKGKEFKL